MNVYKVVRDEVPVFAEPDPTTEPIASADEGDLVLSKVELGDWLKATVRSSSGSQTTGWLESENAELVAEAEQGDVELFREPLGEGSQQLSGLIIPIGISAGHWHKVQVLDHTGDFTTGWIEVQAPQPAPPPPSPVVEPKGTLKLGINDVYRDALLKAEERTKIDASALAALIDAEASKVRSGPRKGQWNQKAYNNDSGAAGLTQFLASTWKDWAKERGTMLNERARELGYLTSGGNIKSGKLNDILELRFDPELSIVSAAEYGLSNLKMLQRRRLIPEDATDDQKAWYMYLAHHEGAQGATDFLKHRKAYTAADFRRQVGRRASTLIAAAGGDANKAYRDWLLGYMDEHIQPHKFRTSGRKKPPAPIPRPDEVGVSLHAITGAYRAALENFPSEPLPVSSIGGDRSLAKAIQEELTISGYLDPPADGLWGQISNWALSEFCRHNGLSLGEGFTKQIASTLLDPAARLGAIQSADNWFDKVIAYMQAMNYFICRHPDAQNIVYIEGMNVDGSLNDDVENRFNDVRSVFTVNKHGVPKFEVWDGTTEPGIHWTVNPMSPKGAARIAFNQYKSWRVGVHRASSRSRHEALVQVTPVSVHRDLDKNYIRTNDRIDTGVFGINQHWGYDRPKDDLGQSSAGCLVGRMTNGHRQFMNRIKKDPRYRANNSYTFVTAILPGDKL